METDRIKKEKQRNNSQKRNPFEKNIAKVFSPSKTIIGAAALMMVAVLLTKLFGFLRLALMGSNIQLHPDLDLFNAANAIPEVIFNIIALGSINAAIIPIITKSKDKEGNEKTNLTISSILNLGAFIFIVVGIIIFFLSDPIANLLVSNESGRYTVENIDKLSSMIKVLILSPIILALSSTLASLLQIQRKFFITQIAPLFYNLGIIISIYTFVPWMNGDPMGLCYGVILGSVLHLLCEIPGFIGTPYKFKVGYVNLKDKYLQTIGKLMIPRSLGLAAEQAAFIVQTQIALNLYQDSLSIYKFALSLRDIPISFFGMTLAQAVFPALSEDANKDSFKEFNKKLQYTFQQILFLVVPAAILFIILKLPILRLTYGLFGKNFDFETLNRISWVLMFLSFTIVFQAVLNLLVRAYYALSNTKVPFIVSVVVIIVEILLSFQFVDMFKNQFQNDVGAIGALGLASSVASALGAFLLMYFLHKKTHFINIRFLFSSFKKLFSGLLMAFSVLAVYRFLEIFLDSSRTPILILVLAISLSVGICAYLASEYNLNDDDMRLSAKFFGGVKSALRSIIKNKKKRVTSNDIPNPS